ncbi:MAG: hypothetical protein L3I91_01640 [Mycoplasma sp.]
MADNKEKEAKKEEQEFVINNASVHNQAIDINQNLGSFGDDANAKPEPNKDELDIGDHSAKFEMIKEKPVALNFEKFNKRKQLPDILKIFQRKEKPSGIKQYTGSTRLAITLDKWLRNKKSRFFVWSTALLLIGLIWGIIISLVSINIHLWNTKASTGPYNLWWFQNSGLAGNILGYITLGITFLPLFYLFITLLVGINQVYISRGFHYFLWSCIFIGLVIFIAAVGLEVWTISNVQRFTPPK